MKSLILAAGLMTAATMVIALIMDFTLLPALLMINTKTNKNKNEQTPKEGTSNDDTAKLSQAAE